MPKMSESPAAEQMWNDDTPFPSATADENKPARKRKKSTEAEIVLPETDEEFSPVPVTADLGELIDGTEDDIAAFEEQDMTAPLVSNVGDEESFPAEDEEETPDATPEEDVMAEKKAEKTKVEWIRDEIKALRAKGNDKVRPRDVIANLAEKNVKVTAPQVSVTLRDYDKAKAPAAAKPSRAKKTKPEAETKPSEVRRVTAKVSAAEVLRSKSSMTASVEELATVSGFINELGGVDRARAAIDAYAAYQAVLARNSRA